MDLLTARFLIGKRALALLGPTQQEVFCDHDCRHVSYYGKQIASVHDFNGKLAVCIYKGILAGRVFPRADGPMTEDDVEDAAQLIAAAVQAVPGVP